MHNDNDLSYLKDARYIEAALEDNKKDLKELKDELNKFKLDTGLNIKTITIKLSIYVGFGTFLLTTLLSVIVPFILEKIT